MENFFWNLVGCRLYKSLSHSCWECNERVEADPIFFETCIGDIRCWLYRRILLWVVRFHSLQIAKPFVLTHSMCSWPLMFPPPRNANKIIWCKNNHLITSYLFILTLYFSHVFNSVCFGSTLIDSIIHIDNNIDTKVKDFAGCAVCRQHMNVFYHYSFPTIIISNCYLLNTGTTIFFF